MTEANSTSVSSNSTEWTKIIGGALLGAIFTLLGSIVYFHYQDKEPILVYEILPSAAFQSEERELTIHSARIENQGALEAEEVSFLVLFPVSAVLQDQTVKASSTTLAESVKLLSLPDSVRSSSNSISYSIPLLNSGENVSYSFLLEGIMSDEITIELRAKGVNGTVRVTQSDDTLSYSKLLIWIFLTAGFSTGLALVLAEHFSRKRERSYTAIKIKRREV